jgi:hypothetical protein
MSWATADSAVMASSPAAGPLQQLKVALADAQTHLDRIPRHNKLAVGIQQKIIAQYENRIAELTEGWINE